MHKKSREYRNNYLSKDNSKKKMNLCHFLGKLWWLITGVVVLTFQIYSVWVWGEILTSLLKTWHILVPESKWVSSGH